MKLELVLKTQLVLIVDTNFYFLSLLEKDTKKLLGFKILNMKKKLGGSEMKKLINTYLKSLKIEPNLSVKFFYDLSELKYFIQSDQVRQLQNNFSNVNFEFLKCNSLDLEAYSFLNKISSSQLQQLWDFNFEVKHNKKKIIEYLKNDKQADSSITLLDRVKILQDLLEKEFGEFPYCPEAKFLKHRLNNLSKQLIRDNNLFKDNGDYFSLLEKNVSFLETEIDIALYRFEENYKEPITRAHFDLLLIRCGKNAIRCKNQKEAQLRLIFILLYFLGLQINELHFIGYTQLMSLKDNGQTSIFLPKKGEMILKINADGQKYLEEFTDDITYLFQENHFKTITCSVYNPQRPMNEKQLIKMVNSEIHQIFQDLGVTYSYTTRCFREAFLIRNFNII